MRKELRPYTSPVAEVIDVGLGDNVLNVEGTQSVDNYKETEWVNVGEEGEDDEIIPSNQTSLWD